MENQLLNILGNIKKEDENKKQKIDKVLCILEGQDELLLIYKIYKLLKNQNIECDIFTNNIVEVSWGKNTTYVNDCKFIGGNKGCLTPNPAIEALYKSLDCEYNSIIILFDKDCDIDNSIENKIIDIKNTNELTNCNLFLSNPCFEKTCISFFFDKNNISNIKKYIESEYKTIGKSKCKWYKENIQKIKKISNINKFYNVQKIEHLVKLIDVKDLTNKNIDDIIKNLIKVL